MALLIGQIYCLPKLVVKETLALRDENRQIDVLEYINWTPSVLRCPS